MAELQPIIFKNEQNINKHGFKLFLLFVLSFYHVVRYGRGCDGFGVAVDLGLQRTRDTGVPRI